MKLTKSERALLGVHVEHLRKSEVEVQRHFASLLRMLVTVVGPVNDVITTYNLAAKNAREFVEEIASRARDTFDEKSERWQEGDAGQALNSFAEDWEAINLDPLPKIVIIAPELEGDLCQSERLSKLPDETDAA